MFKEFSPLEDKLFQVMDKDGEIIAPEWMPEISDERLVKAFKDMLFARTADLMAVSYQRQGRMFTYPPNFGQEAIAGGMAIVMRDQGLACACVQRVRCMACQRGFTTRHFPILYGL